MKNTSKTYHPFNKRGEQLPLLKSFFVLKENPSWLKNDLEEQKRHGNKTYIWKLTDEIRKKMKLAVVYFEERDTLKNFLEDFIKINLQKGGWVETPESQLNSIIKKHTTDNFNPKNFLNDSYSSKEGEVFRNGSYLFFAQHDIDEAKKLLEYLKSAS